MSVKVPTRIVFRTDASLQIGTGHVRRCLTLATALRERGAECRFVCREHSGNLAIRIREAGFPLTVLPLGAALEPGAGDPAHLAWLGASWQEDAEQTANTLAGAAVNWLVVDHYALDVRWESTMRRMANQLMAIDDLADREHDVDLLLDQNLGRDAVHYDKLVPDAARRLIGPRYALLRPEFAKLRDFSLARRRVPALRRILVSMGGVDLQDATGSVLSALGIACLPDDVDIKAAMGSASPSLESVREQARRAKFRCEVLVDVADMAKLMAESDLAIGAAGGTSWERCCLGLPSLVLVLTDNQSAIAQSLVATGAAESIELGGTNDEFVALIEQLVGDPERMVRISSAAANVCDGLGVDRVTAAMMGGV